MAGAVVVVEVADDGCVVVVHGSIEIRITVLGVLDQDRGGSNRLATEGSVAAGKQIGIFCIADAEVEDIGGSGGGADTACSSPSFTIVKLTGLAAASYQSGAHGGNWR